MTKYILKRGMALDLLMTAGRERDEKGYRAQRSELVRILRDAGQVGVVLDGGQAYITYPSGFGYTNVVTIGLRQGSALKWLREHKIREMELDASI